MSGYMSCLIYYIYLCFKIIIYNIWPVNEYLQDTRGVMLFSAGASWSRMSPSSRSFALSSYLEKYHVISVWCWILWGDFPLLCQVFRLVTEKHLGRENIGALLKKSLNGSRDWSNRALGCILHEGRQPDSYYRDDGQCHERRRWKVRNLWALSIQW